MKVKVAVLLLALSCMLSAWLFWSSDVKMEQLLASREWRSNVTVFLSEESRKNPVLPITNGHVSHIEILSDIKYLPDNSYLRMSHTLIYLQESPTPLEMNFSENGSWSITDNYLRVDPGELRELSPRNPNNKFFTDQHLDFFKELILLDAEQSRRIDIINRKSLLLTGLNHESRLLISN